MLLASPTKLHEPRWLNLMGCLRPLERSLNLAPKGAAWPCHAEVDFQELTELKDGNHPGVVMNRILSFYPVVAVPYLFKAVRKKLVPGAPVWVIEHDFRRLAFRLNENFYDFASLNDEFLFPEGFPRASLWDYSLIRQVLEEAGYQQIRLAHQAEIPLGEHHEDPLLVVTATAA